MLLKQYIRILDMDFLKKFMRYAFFMNYQKGAYLTNTKIDVPIIYDDIEFDEGLRLDVFVVKKIICELKGKRNNKLSLTCSSLKSFEINQDEVRIFDKFQCSEHQRWY